MLQENRRKYLALSVGIFAAVLFVLLKFVGIHYAINDDIAFREILNGSMNGTSDAHLVFVKYILGCFFSLFYRLSSSIDWYGIISFSVIIISIFSVFLCFLDKTLDQKDFILLVLFSFVFSLITYGKDILFMQWTDTAVIAGSTGMFLVYTDHGNQLWKKILILFMFMFSYLLRSKCFFMMLPVLFVLLLNKWNFHFSLSDLQIRERINKMNCAFLAIFLGVVCISSIVERQAYRSEDWQKYRQYNSARSALWDYYGVPPYDANKAFYDSLSLDSDDVNMICMYGTNMINGLDEVKITRIADLAKEQYINSHPVIDRLKDLLKGYYSVVTGSDYIFLEIELVVLSVTLLLTQHNKKTNFTVMGIWMMGILMISFLIWTLRYPPRVIRGILMIQNVALLAMLWPFYPMLMNRRTAAVLLALALPFTLLKCAKLTYSVLTLRRNDQDTLALEQYVNSHSDNIFIEEARVEPNHQFLLSHERKALKMIPTGGWTTLAPFRQQQLDILGIKDFVQSVSNDDRIILVVNEWDDPRYLVKYLKNKGYSVHLHELEDMPQLRGYKLYQLN